MLWLSSAIIPAVLLAFVVLIDRRNPLQLRYQGRFFFRFGSGQFRDEVGKIVVDHRLVECLEERTEKILVDRNAEFPTFWPK